MKNQTHIMTRKMTFVKIFHQHLNLNHYDNEIKYGFSFVYALIYCRNWWRAAGIRLPRSLGATLWQAGQHVRTRGAQSPQHRTRIVSWVKTQHGRPGGDFGLPFDHTEWASNQRVAPKNDISFEICNNNQF